jgi:lysophospholipase L1-like esterase
MKERLLKRGINMRQYDKRLSFVTIILGAMMLMDSGVFAMAPQAPINPKLPTLWIIGDSTVRNGQDTGNNGQWGWGNPIAHFFDPAKINVQNRAVGGTSSRTFQSQKFWDKTLAEIKPGDFLIMQFGHNDASAINDATRARGTIKGNGDETQEIDNELTKQHETVHSYGWYLRKIIADAKAKSIAEVVICSPIPRNRWHDGKIGHTESYTKWAEEAAKQAGVDFIDLNTAVCKLYDAAGEEKVTSTYFPEKETTHPDWAGAVLNAETVIDLLKGLPNCQFTRDLLASPPTDLMPPSGKAR